MNPRESYTSHQWNFFFFGVFVKEISCRENSLRFNGSRFRNVLLNMVGNSLFICRTVNGAHIEIF